MTVEIQICTFFIKRFLRCEHNLNIDIYYTSTNLKFKDQELQGVSMAIIGVYGDFFNLYSNGGCK